VKFVLFSCSGYMFGVCVLSTLSTDKRNHTVLTMHPRVHCWHCATQCQFDTVSTLCVLDSLDTLWWNYL